MLGIDGPGGGDERLTGNLAAEHPLAILVGADASEDVDLDGLEVEERDELVDLGLGHQPSLAQATTLRKVTLHVDTVP